MEFLVSAQPNRLLTEPSKLLLQYNLSKERVLDFSGQLATELRQTMNLNRHD